MHCSFCETGKFIRWDAGLRVAGRFDKWLCCRFCWLRSHYTNIWSTTLQVVLQIICEKRLLASSYLSIRSSVRPSVHLNKHKSHTTEFREFAFSEC